jgi:type IV pilus assembly protein PilC
MAKYEYVALDAKGKETKGTVEATNQTAAIGSIREKGLFPTSINEAGAPATPSAQVKGKGGKPKGDFMKMEFNLNIGFSRVKPKMIMATTRQLATLIQAGMPLVRGLRVLEKQEKHPAMKKAVGEVADSIEAGSTFAEALSAHPKIFNKLFVNMVKAGEIGGILDTVLERLAEFMEKAQKIRNKVKGAMIYPSVILTMAIGILAFLMIFIIPRFEEIFEDMMEGGQLPTLTRMVLATSRGCVRYWYVVVGVVVVVVVLFRLMGKTKRGRYGIDWFKLKSPIFGPLMQKTAISRFARTLGTLMNSGVPVLQSLNIVRDTAGNAVVAQAVHTVHDAVKEGENMAPPIEASGIFPPVVVSMIEVGEETGAVPDMLVRVADNYEDEVDNAVAGITSIIEPILIVFLALIVGTIVIALFLPLISIISNLSS